MITLVTMNIQKDENGDNVGGYHEIHEIKSISNADHIIATVKSVVDNNIKFKNDGTELAAVFISFYEDNLEMRDDVIKYFRENPIDGVLIEELGGK